jgi:hypothetical protein
MGFLFGLIHRPVFRCGFVRGDRRQKNITNSAEIASALERRFRRARPASPAAFSGMVHAYAKTRSTDVLQLQQKLTILWRVHPLDRALRHVCRPQARFGRRDCLVRRPFFFCAIGFDPATRRNHFRTRLGSRESVTILRYEVSASIGNTTASDIATGPAWHRRSG